MMIDFDTLASAVAAITALVGFYLQAKLYYYSKMGRKLVKSLRCHELDIETQRSQLSRYLLEPGVVRRNFEVIRERSVTLELGELNAALTEFLNRISFWRPLEVLRSIASLLSAVVTVIQARIMERVRREEGLNEYGMEANDRTLSKLGALLIHAYASDRPFLNEYLIKTLSTPGEKELASIKINEFRMQEDKALALSILENETKSGFFSNSERNMNRLIGTKLDITADFVEKIDRFLDRTKIVASEIEAKSARPLQIAG